MEHWLEREIAQFFHHEGSIRWSIAPWANGLTTELLHAPYLWGLPLSNAWGLLLTNAWSMRTTSLKRLRTVTDKCFIYEDYLSQTLEDCYWQMLYLWGLPLSNAWGLLLTNALSMRTTSLKRLRTVTDKCFIYEDYLSQTFEDCFWQMLYLWGLPLSNAWGLLLTNALSMRTNPRKRSRNVTHNTNKNTPP